MARKQTTPNVFLDAARMLEKAARQVRRYVEDESLDVEKARKTFVEINANIHAAQARLIFER